MMIWRLLASVLGDRRQPQIKKHEQDRRGRSMATVSVISVIPCCVAVG